MCYNGKYRRKKGIKMEKVVLVEDEILILELLKEYVSWKDYGMEVVGCFQDPLEALKFLVQNECDLLMTDIKMPNMTGLELIEQLGSCKNNIHMIVLSGYNDFEYAQQGIRLGVFDYLLKPLDFEELDRVLKRVHEDRYKKEDHFVREDRYIHSTPKKVGIEKLAGQLYHAIQEDNALCIEQVWRGYFDYIYIQEIAKENTTIEINHIFTKLQEYIPTKELIVDFKHLLGIQTLKEMERYINGCTLLLKEYYDKVEDDKLELVNHIKFVIEQEYKFIRTASQVAEKVNLSTSYTRELVKKYTGITINNYLRQVKIEKARKLLLESDLKIKCIAQEIGYETETYFCKLFEQEKGLTPNEYRKKYKAIYKSKGTYK